MPIYPDSPTDEVLALINGSNLSVPATLSESNVRLGTPAPITPGGGSNNQNTSLLLAAMPNVIYAKTATVKYRRRSLTALFRSIPVNIFKFSPAAVNASPYRVSDLIADINSTYGMNFTADDLVDQALPVGSTTNNVVSGTRVSQVQVAAAPGSLSYVDSFTLNWIQAPQDISGMILTPTLTGRVFPGGATVVDPTAVTVDLDTYGIDWSTLFAANGTASVLNNLASFAPPNALGVGWAGNAAKQAADTNLITILNQATGKNYNLTSPVSGDHSIFGAGGQGALLLPNLLCQEANSAEFNHCLFFDIPPDNIWGVGRLIFHYNV